MTGKFTRFQALLGLGLLVFSACKPPRSSQAGIAETTEIANQATNRCDQKIRYYSEKMFGGPNREEVIAHTEIVIDPIAKLINLKSEPPGQGKREFDTVIEGFECNFNAALTEGEASYRGYIKQTDGRTSSTHLKIEFKDGELTIAGNAPGQPVQLTIFVSKWEVIDQ